MSNILDRKEIVIFGATGTIGKAVETLKALNMDPSPGKPAAEVAKGYVKSTEGQESGQVIEI
jgi:hypothetical protein